MNELTNLLSPLAEGWVMTLFHSLWQGALIAGLVYLVLWMFNVHNPRVRYGVGVAGLAVFVLSIGITLFQVMPEPRVQAAAADMPSEITFVQLVTEGMAATDTGWSILTFLKQNMPFIIKLWAVGAILLLFRIIGGYQYLRKIVRRSEDTVPQNWLNSIDSIAKRLGISRTVRVLHSAHVDMPMVFGHTKPILLLPVSLLTGMTHDQLEAIFAHELAHIRRHDYLVNIGQQILEATFFFNPFIWMLSGLLRSEREKCCDDLAMEICHNERQYVEALSTLELYRLHSPSNAMMLLGQKGELLSRIRRLTDPTYGEMGSSKWVFMIVLSASFFLFSYFTEPKEPSTEKITVKEVKQEPLMAAIPGSYIIRQDTIPKEKEVDADLDVDVDIDEEIEVEEIIEERIDADGKVHVYRYFSSPGDNELFFVGPDGEWEHEIIEIDGPNSFAFVMPDKVFDIKTWTSDSTNSFSYFFGNDTIPNPHVPNFYIRDSLMSDEDKEALRAAQEEMRRAKELLQEEHERMREIMEKYREEHPELIEEQRKAMREQSRAMRELHENMNQNRFEVIVPDVNVSRIVRDHQRLSQHEMQRVQRELERAQHQIARVMPPNRIYTQRVEVRPFFDRNQMDGFQDQVAGMLRNDDYLNNDDELRKIELTEDYFKYNGRKVKGGDFERYLRAYESRFGKLEGKINIQLDN